MLSPEVWNFSAPKSDFKIENGDFVNETNCLDNINKYYYNHLVSLVLPDTFKVPEFLSESLLVNCEYYKVTNLNVSELVDVNFIENFVKKGHLIVLSTDTQIDCDDCICITSDGFLLLSLNRETYQRLGLEGKVSHFTHKTKSRYVVTINLKDKCLKPNKANYEKIKKGLTKLNNFSFIFNWEPYKEDICPSSIAKYFHDLNYNVKLCLPQYKVHTEYTVQVPTNSFENFDVADSFEFAEWLGMLSLKCDLESGAPSNYLTTYETPEPKNTVGQIKILQWRGFFTNQQILHLYDNLKKYVNLEKKQWVSMYVQGFSDTPTITKEHEHHFYTNGDNSYILLLNNTNYLLCKQNCSKKQYK